MPPPGILRPTATRAPQIVEAFVLHSPCPVVRPRMREPRAESGALCLASSTSSLYLRELKCARVWTDARSPMWEYRTSRP